MRRCLTAPSSESLISLSAAPPLHHEPALHACRLQSSVRKHNEGHADYQPPGHELCPSRQVEDMAQAGRYPFLTWAYRYLDGRTNWYSAATLEVKRRNARTIQRNLTEMRERNLVSTTDPRGMQPEDVTAFIRYLQESGVEASYTLKLLEVLKPVVAYTGNNAFTRLEMQGYEMPRRVRKELVSLDDEELHKIWNAAAGMEGWWGDLARFTTAFYPFTGVRPSELRRAQVEDVDTRRWEFYVRHPKGEFRYGEKRTVPILPPAREATLTYLKARQQWLNGRQSNLLCPTLRHGVIKEYSENVWRRIKRNIGSRAGVDDIEFSFKTFRSTFCQMNIDKDEKLLPAVSKAMGHGSTDTTEKYYGRIRQKNANDALVNAWLPKQL